MIGIVIVVLLVLAALINSKRDAADLSAFTRDDTVGGLVYAPLPLVLANSERLLASRWGSQLRCWFRLIYGDELAKLAMAVQLSKGIVISALSTAFSIGSYSLIGDRSFLLLGLAFSAVLLILPPYLIKKRYDQKVSLITRQMPAFLHQIALLLKSGTTLERSLQIIYDGYSDGHVINQILSRVYSESDRGTYLLQAFRILPELITDRAMHHFALLMSQASKTGVHRLAIQLVELSEQLQRERQASLKTLSEQLSTKMLMPLMVSMAMIMTILIYPILSQF